MLTGHPVLNRSTRMRMAERQGYRCVRCGDRLNVDRRAMRAEHADSPTLDHVIPRASGGRDAIGNFVVLHRKCNHRKDSAQATGCEVLWALVHLIRA